MICVLSLSSSGFPPFISLGIHIMASLEEVKVDTQVLSVSRDVVLLTRCWHLSAVAVVENTPW